MDDVQRDELQSRIERLRWQLRQLREEEDAMKAELSISTAQQIEILNKKVAEKEEELRNIVMEREVVERRLGECSAQYKKECSGFDKLIGDVKGEITQVQKMVQQKVSECFTNDGKTESNDAMQNLKRIKDVTRIRESDLLSQQKELREASSSVQSLQREILRISEAEVNNRQIFVTQQDSQIADLIEDNLATRQALLFDIADLNRSNNQYASLLSKSKKNLSASAALIPVGGHGAVVPQSENWEDKQKEDMQQEFLALREKLRQVTNQRTTSRNSLKASETKLRTEKNSWGIAIQRLDIEVTGVKSQVSRLAKENVRLSHEVKNLQARLEGIQFRQKQLQLLESEGTAQ